MLKPAFAALLLLAGSALAAEPRTVTLAVDQMTCAACPITVHKALSHVAGVARATDRKSTRLNSSHGYISYAVFCLKKKKKKRRYRADIVDDVLMTDEC